MPPADPSPATGRPPTGASAVLAHEVAPRLVASDAPERTLSTDQVNHSVLVGDAVVVKWYATPPPTPCRSERLLTHLREVGFDEMPPFIGVATEQQRVLAVLSGYLPGVVDGWDWWVQEVAADLAAALDSAARVGALTARLHRALAAPSSVFPHPVQVGDLADEARRATGLLDQALACTAGEAGERLAARAARVQAGLDALRTATSVTLQQVHGDLHAGQFLRHRDVLAVTDFDGDPLADPVEQQRPRSPLVDLASLLQSIDHVGRVAVKYHPHRHDAIAAWIPVAMQVAHTAYADEWPDGVAHPRHTDLLDGLRAAQELHEFVYAATALPIWLYVPDAALTAMFPDH